MSSLDERLAQLGEGVLVGGGDYWDPLLHPRGRDGRFIKVGGWVRALFRLADGRDVRLNGKVTGFRVNPNKRSDLIVEAITKEGPATTLVSKVMKVAEPKGTLSMKLPWNRGDTDKVNERFEKEWEPFETAIARVNAAAEKLHLTDPELRAKGLNPIMNGVRGSSMSTAYIYNKRGKSHDEWDAQRVAKHEQLWEAFIGRVRASGVQRDRDALVLGGLPGAGKTSSLRPGEAASEFGVVGWNTIGDPPPGVTHISLDPDTLKELMIHAGMLPEGVSPLIKPREQVSFIHAESNFLVSLFFSRLSDEGWNVVYDTTMANVPHVVKNISPLAEAGYKFKGLFIDIPREESKTSALSRYIREFRPDDLLGSRFVPSEAGSAGSARGYNSGNRDVFEDMENWFDGGWMVVDNTGISKQRPRRKIVARGVGDGSRTIRYREPKYSRPIKHYKSSKADAAGMDNLMKFMGWEDDPPEEEEIAPELTAKEITAKYGGNPSAGPPVVAAGGTAEFRHSIGQLLVALRSGFPPEEALTLLQSNAVAVPDEADDDHVAPSLLPHELLKAGADQALLDAVADEVLRLRREGITMDAYMEEPVVTAALTASARKFNPLLHPRGKDGRFIKVGGWVRGLFDIIDGDGREMRRAKVTRVSSNPGNPDNPRIYAVTDLGEEVVATVDRIDTAAPTKAMLDFDDSPAIEWRPGNYNSEYARFEYGNFFDEARGREVPRAEGHVYQSRDGTFSIDLNSHGVEGGSTPWLDVWEGGFPTVEAAQEAAQHRFDEFLAAEAGDLLAEVNMNISPNIWQQIMKAISGTGGPVRLPMGSTNSEIVFSDGLVEWDGRTWPSLDAFFAAIQLPDSGGSESWKRDIHVTDSVVTSKGLHIDVKVDQKFKPASPVYDEDDEDYISEDYVGGYATAFVDGNEIGFLPYGAYGDSKIATVGDMEVTRYYRRKGVGTALFNYVRSLGIPLHHYLNPDDMTPAGRAFAEATPVVEDMEDVVDTPVLPPM